MNREKLIASLKEIERLVADCLEAVDEAPSSPAVSNTKTKQAEKAQGKSRKPDLSLPLRPFVNRHGRDLSGPERFALVLAHMTKGKIGLEVELALITKAWNKMTGMLDDFNMAYPTRAKDKGWVDSPKRRFYVLLPGWTEIFDNHAR